MPPKKQGGRARMAIARTGGTAELPQLHTPGYDEGIVRLFVIATMFWAIVGMSMGVILARQNATRSFLNSGRRLTHPGNIRRFRGRQIDKHDNVGANVGVIRSLTGLQHGNGQRGTREGHGVWRLNGGQHYAFG